MQWQTWGEGGSLGALGLPLLLAGLGGPPSPPEPLPSSASPLFHPPLPSVLEQSQGRLDLGHIPRSQDIPSLRQALVVPTKRQVRDKCEHTHSCLPPPGCRVHARPPSCPAHPSVSPTSAHSPRPCPVSEQEQPLSRKKFMPVLPLLRASSRGQPEPPQGAQLGSWEAGREGWPGPSPRAPRQPDDPCGPQRQWTKAPAPRRVWRWAIWRPTMSSRMKRMKPS